MLRHLLGASATAETMLEAIARDAHETGDKTGRPVFSAAVMEAMRTVPREAFVPEAEKPFAYENRPLPIGHGQTISQPFVVALMTELLDVVPGARILEVGTGCGYQTAVLCALGATVYSVEVVEPLATAAAARLKALGYAQATVRAGDGHARLAGGGAVRRHHGHRGGGVCPTGAGGSAQVRRPSGHPCWPRRRDPASCSASRSAPTVHVRRRRCCRWPLSR